MSENFNTEDSGSILIPKISLSEHSEKEFDVAIKRMRRFSINFPKGKWVKFVGLLLLALIIIVSLLGFLTFRVYAKAQAFRKSLENVKQAVGQQDLVKIKKELKTSQTSLRELDSTYKGISWLGIVPFLGSYVRDGQNAISAAKYGFEAADVVIETIEPYADIIGFSSDVKQSGSPEETTQDRIDFVIKTIPGLLPKIDLLSEKAELIKKEVDLIDAERYPENAFGFAVREKLKEGKDLVDVASELVANSKPLMEVAPDLLGIKDEKRYLVIFQNDKELRPTGGFITAYSIAKVNKGRFEPVLSDDIYNLDNKYKPKVEAPGPLIKYIKGPYLLSTNLRLRDMNWSPDFGEAMKLFGKEVESVGIKNIDGIIAVDTQVLVNILDVIGPIGVSGFGEYSTKEVPDCKCPQVIYELESFADIEGPIVWSENEPGKIVYAPPNYDNRKKIIGPLMNSILANALGQPKEKLAPLFEAVFKSFIEKHVLFYASNAKAQEALDAFGIAGTLKDYEGDYLHINNANLGGRKSNLYIKEEISQEMEVGKDGSIVKTVIITYKNPEKHDGWLNSVLPNWVRIYVPKGSELIDFAGVEEKVDPYEELGKTVFAGFFKLRPEGIAKVTLKYKLPFKTSKEYKLFIQKQPGSDTPLYSVSLKKHKEEFFLRVDKELKFTI